MLKFLILATAAIATSAAAAPRDAPDVKLEKLLAGRTAGKPTDCIQLRSIRSSEIIDGQAIVYRVGRTLYVNQPRSGASSLRDDDVLVTNTHSSQLCSIDVVRLVDRSTQFPRGFISLSEFVPYTEAPKR